MKRIFVSILAAALLISAGAQAGTIKGKVTCGGKPVKGVFVSDGLDIVKTGARGEYTLKSDKRQGFVFVISPSGYTVPLMDGLQPKFYAHLTEPSGVTEVHDFELVEQNQDRYTVIFATDIHIKNNPQLHDKELVRKYLIPHVREQYQKNLADGPVFMMNLGDLAHDKDWYNFDWNIEKAYNFLRDEGYPGPLYSVMGNHDNDGATTATPQHPDEDFNAEWLYRKAMGPTYYSMNIGNDHWVMLDNIRYVNTPAKSKDLNIAGKRDYTIGLTSDEMEWLKKDLATVPEGTNVRVCSHASFLFEFPAGKGTQFTSNEEMDEVYGMFTHFGTMKAYTGHTHRFQFARNERYPLVRDLMIPAVSGNVWANGENQMLGIDACDAGIIICHFRGNEVKDEYLTHVYGEKWMRTYDMNAVQKYFQTDEVSASRLSGSPEWTDYGKGDRKNMVYANIWMWRPEYTVEMYENGKKLTVEKVDESDPLLLISPITNKTFFKQHKFVVCHHLFRARARKPKSKVRIVLRDETGRIVHETVMTRPKAFSTTTE